MWLRVAWVSQPPSSNPLEEILPLVSTYSTFPQVIDDTKGSTIGPLVAHHPKSVKRSYTDSGTVTSSDKKGNYWCVFEVA